MRIGSRGSRLAVIQAEHVSKLLGGPDVVKITTSGDEGSAKEERGRGGEIAIGNDAIGDKSRWVDAIEQALIDGRIDLAVHSAKDVPGELAPGLSLLGAPRRAPAEDVICGVSRFNELAEGARVGTSSLRRAAQIKAVRPDLQIVEVRGNVETRLRKLSEDASLAAIVLARAGLHRLGLESAIGATLDPKGFVPSPGQGILALQGRDGDRPVYEAAEAITDVGAFACLRAERAVSKALKASCNTPLGAHASSLGSSIMLLRCWVGLPNGSQWLSDELQGSVSEPEELGLRLGERMRSAGAAEMLAEAEAMAR